MYTLISGSPKPHSSNSLHFLKNISSSLDDYKIFELKKDKYEDILNSIKKSDVIVLAFPLYVDSPSSITLNFLDHIIDNEIKLDGKQIYTVVNCGFREGEQNITASNIIKCWCQKSGATYSSSLLIGAGEIVGKVKYKFISRKALKELKKFTYTIKQKQIKTDTITTMDLINNKLYCYIANKSWDKKGRINNLTNSDLKIR